MMDVLKSVGIGGLAVLACFYLVRDVLAPLVKSVTRKAKPNGSPETRILALEVDLGKVSTRVEDFSTLLQEYNASVDTLGRSMDNKMDIVLQELSEMRSEFTEAYRAMTERIAKAETHIEHLLRTRGRGAN